MVPLSVAENPRLLFEGKAALTRNPASEARSGRGIAATKRPRRTTVCLRSFFSASYQRPPATLVRFRSASTRGSAPLPILPVSQFLFGKCNKNLASDTKARSSRTISSVQETFPLDIKHILIELKKQRRAIDVAIAALECLHPQVRKSARYARRSKTKSRRRSAGKNARAHVQTGKLIPFRRVAKRTAPPSEVEEA